MAEKDFNNRIKVPNVDEMSDIDFVYSIDYLSSPYYKQYMDAHMRRNENQFVNQQIQKPIEATKKQKNKQKERKAKKVKLYTKKHSACLAIIFILLLVLTASFVLSSFNLVPSIEKYVSTYTLGEVDGTDTINVGIVDPIIGVVKKFVPDFNMTSNYYENTLKTVTNETEILTSITVYAVPVAALLIILCVIIGLLKAIVALSKKSKNGYYKKIGFGFSAIIIFISSLILVFAGLYAGGAGINEIVPFITLASAKINCGYALYGYLAIPIIMLIFSAGSYKKVKTLK